MNIKKLTYSSLATVLLSGFAFSASAVPIINFDQNVPTGTISYDGDGGALIGSDIGFNLINLFGATPPAGNSDNLVCQGCLLNFTTGPVESEGSGTFGEWTFDNGGSFTLTGTALEGDNVIANGELLVGEFGNTPTVDREGESTFRFGSVGTDSKNPDLLDYFGFDPETQFMFANSEISLMSAIFDADGGFSGQVTAADLNNAEIVAAVPEPEELGMFALGFALLGLGMLFRRKSGSMNAV